MLVTVAELVEKLSKIDQSLEVMICDDPTSHFAITYLAGGEVWSGEDREGVDRCFIA